METSRIRVLSYIMTMKPDDPMFAEGATILTADDEGAGPFLIIQQDNNKVRIDFDELPLIVETVDKIKAEWEV